MRDLQSHSLFHFIVGLACLVTGSSVLLAHETHNHAEMKVIQSARNGLWSSPETWQGGKVPGAGAQVLIQRDHQIVYDLDSQEVIRGIQISGKLKFASDRNTRLEVGLIRIEELDHYCEEGFDCQMVVESDEKNPEKQLAAAKHVPTLEVGRPESPLSAQYTALIRLHYIEGMSKENCPAIVCCGGRMDFHGAPLERTWVKLPYQTAKVGEARAVMPYPLPGWKVGDRIILSGTTRQFGYIGTRYRKNGDDNSVADNPTTEERVITKMRHWGGFDSKLQIVSFDKPLEFDHLGSGKYRAEVANLSRNVIVESADPDGVRGHTMYHADSQGSISYAEFRHLGKRDTLGKYPIHYHLVGDTMRGSSLTGLSVWDSHNRWITVHGTQYLVVKDCVGYKSVGHGYFLEDGTEVYNIFDRNLAVQALGGKPLPKQVLPYDANLGSGFWWANSLNTFTRNVAAECDEDGFRFEVVERDDFSPVLPILQKDGSTEKVDVRTLPFVRFDGNEAHCQRLFAINLGGFAGGRFNKEDSDVEGIGPDYQHPFLLRNTKVWDSHWAFHCGAPCVRLEDFDLHDCAYGLWRCVMHRHEYRRLTFSEVNTTVFFPRAAGDADYSYSLKDYFDLEPKDDLPPVTVITRVGTTPSGQILVRGVTSDNYDMKQVLVNGQPVSSTRENFQDWEVVLPGSDSGYLQLITSAEDANGNKELMPHRVNYYHDTVSARNLVSEKQD
ncbi:G8 domain-containing protein [Gimesia maris]|uniref:G8 domain-containing protein n=1 Tax=Gimesia maris TaxID=122 RepID=UPI00241D0069|nr:G8 domain-containing protein [Gimesia maris]|tara:strand:+ start:206646 stop:208817 length:2172 start_codon:yes stop_codon:yes gene_type:complete